MKSNLTAAAQATEAARRAGANANALAAALRVQDLREPAAHAAAQTLAAFTAGKALAAAQAAADSSFNDLDPEEADEDEAVWDAHFLAQDAASFAALAAANARAAAAGTPFRRDEQLAAWRDWKGV